ncbi:MAG: Asp-tRNA(Asn)/Glu-tRNA(Gln) amidotransferase subunit GatC [Bacteroidota bacterium]
MEINDQMIDHLAQLAKLSFKEDEKDQIKQDLQQMIDFVGKLQEIDTAGVDPLIHMTLDPGPLRADVVKEGKGTSATLKNAPKKTDEFFVVPKVIHK